MSKTGTDLIGKAHPEPQTRARVFLIEDHPIVVQGLTQIINQERDLIVCGHAAGVHYAREEIRRLKPDLAVADIALKEINGLELIKALRSQFPELPILTLSMHDEAVYAERSLRAGAGGYIMKDQATENLVGAIRKVLSGDIYLSERMTSVLLHQIAERRTPGLLSPVERLSDRELEVFELIGKGHGTKEIANELHLSIKTIESYREQIKQKLSLHNATQLIQDALRWVENGQATKPRN